MNWANRLILGDNRAVMASLAQREGYAGKVQMIYIDPPYGIKFKSNFQPEIGKHGVQDSDSDLTREMETVQAYRDTWHLGIHSYLNYMRECLALSKMLLSESGSVFIQIGEENLHLIRSLADEVFGKEQFESIITVKKTATPSRSLDSGFFYVVWYSKNANHKKYNQLYVDKPCDEWARDTPGGSWGVEIAGHRRALRPEEKRNTKILPPGSEVYRLSKLKSAGPSGKFKVFEFHGELYEVDGNTHWKTGASGWRGLSEPSVLRFAKRTPGLYGFIAIRRSNVFQICLRIRQVNLQKTNIL